jgi:SAM-dependent methyltransferase
LAEWFDTHVVGVDPSLEMLQVARRRTSDSVPVKFIVGCAEAIPLRSQVSMVFMSNVLHHVREWPRFTAELLRVVTTGGYVVIRTMVREYLALEPLFRFFPSAAKLEAQRVLDVVEIARRFTACGFTVAASEHVVQEGASSLAEYLPRIEARVVSVLQMISDEDFEIGVESARRCAAADSAIEPVREHLHLFVFRLTASV